MCECAFEGIFVRVCILVQECVRWCACNLKMGVGGGVSLSVCTFYRLYLFILFIFFRREKKKCEDV